MLCIWRRILRGELSKKFILLKVAEFKFPFDMLTVGLKLFLSFIIVIQSHYYVHYIKVFSCIEFDVNSHLIILGQSLRSAWGASLDLPGAEADDKVRDEAILSFSGAMGDHGTPTVGLG